MVVAEAAATMAVMHFTYAFRCWFQRVYCTVQYIMETCDYNSIEPAIQGGCEA